MRSSHLHNVRSWTQQPSRSCDQGFSIYPKALPFLYFTSSRSPWLDRCIGFGTTVLFTFHNKGSFMGGHQYCECYGTGKFWYFQTSLFRSIYCPSSEALHPHAPSTLAYQGFFPSGTINFLQAGTQPGNLLEMRISLRISIRF